MPQTLLDGVRIVDLAGEPAAMAGRLLADMGAQVVRVEPPTGDPLRAVAPFVGERSLRFAAWNAGKTSLACEADDPRLDALLAGADVVIQTPGWPGVLEVAPERAPSASWIRVTPFGGDGPRSGWRATDLGVMARPLLDTSFRLRTIVSLQSQKTTYPGRASFWMASKSSGVG